MKKPLSDFWDSFKHMTGRVIPLYLALALVLFFIGQALDHPRECCLTAAVVLGLALSLTLLSENR